MAAPETTIRQVVEAMDSFQYKWASAALHEAEPGNYSPALHRVVENISVVYTA